RGVCAIGFDVLADVFQGIVRDVNPIGIDATVTKGFHQDAHRTTSVQHARRADVRDDALSDVAEEVQPVLATSVLKLTFGAEVAQVVEPIVYGGCSLLLVHGSLRPIAARRWTVMMPQPGVRPWSPRPRRRGLHRLLHL